MKNNVGTVSQKTSEKLQVQSIMTLKHGNDQQCIFEKISIRKYVNSIGKNSQEIFLQFTESSGQIVLYDNVGESIGRFEIPLKYIPQKSKHKIETILNNDTTDNRVINLKLFWSNGNYVNLDIFLRTIFAGGFRKHNIGTKKNQYQNKLDMTVIIITSAGKIDPYILQKKFKKEVILFDQNILFLKNCFYIIS